MPGNAKGQRAQEVAGSAEDRQSPRGQAPQTAIAAATSCSRGRGGRLAGRWPGGRARRTPRGTSRRRRRCLRGGGGVGRAAPGEDNHGSCSRHVDVGVLRGRAQTACVPLLGCPAMKKSGTPGPRGRSPVRRRRPASRRGARGCYRCAVLCRPAIAEASGVVGVVPSVRCIERYEPATHDHHNSIGRPSSVDIAVER